MNPRSTNQIISDLLQATIDGQWSDEHNTACHCHPVWERCCAKCKADHCEPHAPDCKLTTLIEETRAFLRAENKLAEEQGKDDETVYIP